MTRDQIATSLKAAGYGQGEINRALRRTSRRPNPKPAGTGTPDLKVSPAVEPALAYIRQYRTRIPRSAIQKQLLIAGHSAAAIDAALSASDAELRAHQASTRRLEGLLMPALWALAGIYAAFQVLPEPVAVVVAVLVAGALIWLVRRRLI